MTRKNLPKNKSEEDTVVVLKQLNYSLTKLVKKNTPQYKFLLGIFSGLGTVFGLTVVLTFILYILTRLSFVPVLGDVATQIVRIVQSNLGN